MLTNYQQTEMKSLIKIMPLWMFNFLKKIKHRLYLHIGKRHPRKLLEILYRAHYGRNINLENPKDIDEKVNYMKLYADTTLWSRCADKWLVREYVRERGLGHTLNEVYGVFDRAEDIDFDTLPNSFVIKTTNGGGGNSVLVVKDKQELNRAEVVKTLNEWLKIPMGDIYAERHYSEIVPRLMVEKYLEDQGDSVSLLDYKFNCFDGNAYSIFFCSDREFGKYVCYSVYDLDWTLYPEKMHPKYRTDKTFPRPCSLDKMIEYSQRLSLGIPYVRVDWYEIDGEPIFGEMTFTPAGGFQSFYSEEYRMELGQQIDLSKVELR